MQVLEPFINFLNRSPTAYHAAKEICEKLAETDFTPITESEKWELEPGKSYFLTRDDVLVAAFTLPKKKPKKAILLASHLDSPGLKLKPKPLSLKNEISQISTEIYGAPLLYTWFDRDLAIAGRILVEQKNGECVSKLIYLDDYSLIIPSIAIHFEREVNDKGFVIDKQNHLKAISTLHQTKGIEELLKKHHSFQKLLAFDLFLVPIERGQINGAHSELISSYRLDNLSSAFSCLEAIQKAKAQDDTLQIAFFWDHEEIGSQTFAGADSIFASELFMRISNHLKMSPEEYYQMKSRSLCLSCDAGHAFHPNYSEKNDPENTPHLGLGPIVKYSSRYATNAKSAAPIMHLAKKNKIPLQTFASRTDLKSGGTVGAMMGASLGISTVDLGISMLGMHSIRETIAGQDQIWLNTLLEKALSSPLVEIE